MVIEWSIMNDKKEYKPYNQLLNEIDKLKDPNFVEGRKEIITIIKDLIGESYQILGLDTTIEDEPSGYKWVILKIEDNIIKGAVFTDIKGMSKKVGVSDKTIRRRLKEMNGTGRIKINGFTIQEMPYFKSKRGPNNETEQ